MTDAALAAALLALDPAGLGGAVLRAAPGPVRDAWLGLLRDLLPAGAPVRRLPPHAPDDRLLGGLDLAATLAAGRPVARRGLLAEADGGVVLIAGAERVSPGMAGRLCAVLDRGCVAAERDGFALRAPARFGLVALDESVGDAGAGDEGAPASLLDRLAFRPDLSGFGAAGPGPRSPASALPTSALPTSALSDWTALDPAALDRARAALPRVRAGRAVMEALCATADALGVSSLRAPWLALRAALASAALAGRRRADRQDAAVAARLVLAPRATRLPAPEDRPPPDPAESEADGDSSGDADGEGEAPDRPMGEVVLASARAAIPPGLLVLAPGGARAREAGRSGARQIAARHGRPAGVRPGEPRAGARLNLVATLRAAAPWQPLRRDPSRPARVQVRREDFHVTRFRHDAKTAAIFAVDASGSAALHRLAEAKGAVELLLAECYVRRDRVALLAFRGAGAEVLLPPTASLVRAKRCLAGLPGGGGTPLAAGIEAALGLAGAVRRAGQVPVVALLTDGRANLARDGAPGRPRAEADALAAARAVRAAGVACVLLDTSPRPAAFARRLADEMGARYLTLPQAGAASISGAVRAAVRRG